MAESEVRKQSKLASSLLLTDFAHLLLLSISPDNTMDRRLASSVTAFFDIVVNSSVNSILEL